MITIPAWLLVFLIAIVLFAVTLCVSQWRWERKFDADVIEDLREKLATYKSNWIEAGDGRDAEARERKNDCDSWIAGATLVATLESLRGGPPVVVHLERVDHSLIEVLDVPKNVTITWTSAPNFFVHERGFVAVKDGAK